MTEPNSSKRAIAAFVHLDFARGLSALAVLVYHVRYRFFVDYSELESPGLVAKLFYSATSFGHDAVMAFFVLSGFFISSSIVRSARLKKWSWTEYLLNRTTRLYVVLVPTLALTWIWDNLGIAFYGDHPVYTGLIQGWKHDYFNVEERFFGNCLLGNLTFLQTIYVPPYGSNEPLWSLAYEFWYYGLFPCLYLPVFFYKSWIARLMCLGVAVAIAALVGHQILLYFPIWLLGAAVGFLPTVAFLQGRAKVPATVLAVLLAMALASVAHVSAVKNALGGSTIIMDYLTGIGFAILVYVLMHHQTPAKQGAYTRFAKGTADFSFTLYLTHIPLLVLLRAAWIQGRPWAPSNGTISMAVVISLIAIIYAVVVYWIAERKTLMVKSWIFARLRGWSLIAERGEPKSVGCDS